jgi:hypothetical protein
MIFIPFDVLAHRDDAEIAEAGVLFGPGAMFSPTGDWTSETSGHYRISFSNLEVCFMLHGFCQIHSVCVCRTTR